MSFSQYKSLGATLKELEITFMEENFMREVPFAIRDYLLIEAKQDNFDAAWGQCLAEMYAAQKLNNLEDLTVFGITSNGKFWQFGKLEGDTFTRNKTFYSIQEIEHLFAAVNFIFQDCDRQLTSMQ